MPVLIKMVIKLMNSVSEPAECDPEDNLPIAAWMKNLSKR